MIKVRPIRRNNAGDPVMVIEVAGWYDIYRFANHLTTGQVEFADIGFRVIRRARKRIGAKRWWTFMNRLWGDGDFGKNVFTKQEIRDLRRRSGLR